MCVALSGARPLLRMISLDRSAIGWVFEVAALQLFCSSAGCARHTKTRRRSSLRCSVRLHESSIDRQVLRTSWHFTGVGAEPDVVAED